MPTTSPERLELIRRVARAVRRSTKTGLWGNDGAVTRGVPIAFDGLEPTAWLPLDEVERRVADVTDLALRRFMQARLGLGDYRSWASSDRQAEINRLYDRRPVAARQTASPRPSRTITDRLSEDVAAVLLASATSGPRSQYDSTRLLYSRSITLPDGNVGEVEEVHRRIIRAETDGLDRILVRQSEHWNSTITASARGLGGVKIAPARVREDEHNNLKGERLDVEITFPLLNIGDPPRELQWTRRRTLEAGWRSSDNSFVFASVPDHPTELMVIEVQFGDGALPQTVTRFSDVYQGDRLDPDISVTTVPVRAGAVRCEWQHPRVGLASGLRVWW